VLSIGVGKALHEMVAQELAEAGLPRRSSGASMHFSNGWRGIGDLQKLGREADAALCEFTGATRCSYFEERGRRQSKFTTEEARFEHASKRAKKGARTRRAAADAAGVTLGSLISSKFGDADGADPSVVGEAGGKHSSFAHRLSTGTTQEEINATSTLKSAAAQVKASNIRASEAYADPSTTSRPDLRSDLTAGELELICDGCNMTAAAWVRRGGGSSAAAPAKLGAACTKQAWTKHRYNCRIANGVKAARKAASANGK